MFQRQQIRVYSRECLTYCVVTSFKQSESSGLRAQQVDSCRYTYNWLHI